MLGAYLIGQVPSGLLADRFGGARVLLAGLAAWSAATALTAAAAMPPETLLGGSAAAATATATATAVAALYASRLLLGLSSACAMPATTAAAVEWVPAPARAGAVAGVYAWFNLGGVAGLALAPRLAAAAGLPAAFLAAGAAGLLWAAGSAAALAAAGLGRHRQEWLQHELEERRHRHEQHEQHEQHPQQEQQVLNQQQQELNQQQQQQQQHSQQQPVERQAAGDKPAAGGDSAGGLPSLLRLSPAGRRQVALLCAAHAVIGCGFFLMQNWIPLYISSLGSGNALGAGAGAARAPSLAATGALSALPWLAAAAAGTLAGRAADAAIRRGGARPLTVRRRFQAAAFAGCAASALPLALVADPPLALAVGCLVANLASYSLSFGGFHAHLQDVAGASAGALQGLTNSCSIAAGALGSLATGRLVEATGAYGAAFGALAALYAAAAAVWAACLTADPVE